MLDKILFWIAFIALFISVTTIFALGFIFLFRKGTRHFFPTWEKTKTLCPVPENVTASFWGWHKAFFRSTPCGTLWRCQVQATTEGLLVRRSIVWFSSKKDTIHLPWNLLVYPHEPYEDQSTYTTRFFRTHVEFQIYGTEWSIIAPQEFWETNFPGQVENGSSKATEN